MFLLKFCCDDAHPRSAKCSALLLIVLLKHSGSCWEKCLPRHQVALTSSALVFRDKKRILKLHMHAYVHSHTCVYLHLYTHSLKLHDNFPKVSILICTFTFYIKICLFSSCLLFSVIFSKSFLSSLMSFDVNRDPSMLVCCTGWHQEGKECSQRESVLRRFSLFNHHECFF